MIRFSCKCGLEFNVADGRAGEMTQCPRCGLLVDVPRADELAWLAADGSYAVDDTADPPPAEMPGHTLADMYRAYSRRTTDAAGVEKDLRPAADHFDRLGDEPAHDPHRPVRIAPRYDPATGERILPLGLKDEAPVPVIPVAVEVDPSEIDTVADDDPLPVEALPVMAIPVGSPAKPVRSLGYATGDANRGLTARTLPADLLVRPGNATVLVFVWCFYVVAYLTKIPLNAFGLVVLHVPTAVMCLLNLPLWLLAAHYGCVLEDFGPEAIDELPRPLRNLAIAEDLVGPAVRVGAAGLLCFGPMLVVGGVTGMATGPAAAATLLLAAVGTFAFPAVVLTLITGTTVLNLSPPRLLGVIARCGGGYAVSAGLCGLALALSLGVVLGPSVLPVLAPVTFLHAFERPVVLVPALAATVYVTHLFACHLGLMYRAHHDTFPWLAQRHVPTPRPDRPAVAAGTRLRQP